MSKLNDDRTLADQPKKEKSELEKDVEALMEAVTQLAKTLGMVQSDVAAIYKLMKAGRF